jgi:hypothetical protein
MTAIKVKKDTYSGASKVYDAGADGLAAAVRGLAIDHARIKVEVAQVADLTDNSTGTNGGAIVAMTVPTAAFDASAAGGVTSSALNTSLGKLENAGAVLVQSLNNVRARLGLDILSHASGTVAAADTIPAQDLTGTGGTGNTTPTFTSAVTALTQAKKNVYRLARATNEVLVAIGEEPLDIAAMAGMPSDYALTAITATSASADGVASVAKTVVDAFLAAVANNLASIAYAWNSAMVQGGLSDLTDSSGGTASTGLAALTMPTPANGAATTSSPKAGFDTALGIIEENLSEVATRMNVLRRRYGLAPYTDSTGATVDGTLSSQAVDLSAVDGSSGTSAVDQVSALDRLGKIKNAQSSLAQGINDLVGFFGLDPLTDALGGTKSTTISNIAATGTGVGGSTGTPTLLDTEVDAALVVIRNNNSTLAATLNGMTGTGAPTKPLSVVAQ